jgi:rsbT co-antagonist protein RsbR
MSNQVLSWFNQLPLTDPIERRQAGLLQAMLLTIIVGGGLGLLMNMITAAPGGPRITSPAYPILLICSMIGLVLLRRGWFRPAAFLAAIGLIVAIGNSMVTSGLDSGSLGFLAFAIPITLAGLVIGRSGLLIASGLSVAFVLLGAIVQANVTPTGGRSPFLTVATFILIISVLGLFLDRFGASLKEALVAAMSRERELEALQASLEATVAERTASLREALTEVEQREARLAKTLEDLQTSKETIREMSSPVIPVLAGVLVTPLVGSIDEQRAEDFAQVLLGEVERQHATHVIMDVTGVQVIDTQVALTLLRTATSVQLLGARTLLAGIRPEVAQTIVSLGVDLSAIPTFADLRNAVESLARTQFVGQLRVN